MSHNKAGGELWLKGYPICPGIAIGGPFYFAAAEDHIPEFVVSQEHIDNEVDRYYVALKNSRNDLRGCCYSWRSY